MSKQEIHSLGIIGLPNQQATLPPLVVDLDGTLIKTDSMAESFFSLIRQNPLYVFLLPFWLLLQLGRHRIQRLQSVPALI